MALDQTPSQTVGPFFHCGLVLGGENILVREGVRGTRIVVEGQVIDGQKNPVPDALVEIWQADAAGIYDHPNDPRHAAADPAFRGFGRSDTSRHGVRFRFETVKPGRVAGSNGGLQAPHLCVHLFSRGLLTHLATRCYFADESDANAADEVLNRIDPARRATLLAVRDGDENGAAVYQWNIRLQGEGETVFFEP